MYNQVNQNPSRRNTAPTYLSAGCVFLVELVMLCQQKNSTRNGCHLLQYQQAPFLWEKKKNLLIQTNVIFNSENCNKGNRIRHNQVSKSYSKSCTWTSRITSICNQLHTGVFFSQGFNAVVETYLFFVFVFLFTFFSLFFFSRVVLFLFFFSFLLLFNLFIFYQ